MEHDTLALGSVSDDALLRRLGELVSHSRRVEADLVAHIGEVDARRLFARFAHPSMFAYCTEGLHLSEAEAYRRITVARASRRHPVLLEMLRDGRLHLSGIARLVPLLTADNVASLLERAIHRTKRQIEELVAELSPKPDAPSLIRKLPSTTQTRGRARSSITNGTLDREPRQLVPGRVDPETTPPAPTVLPNTGAQPLVPRSPVLKAIAPDRHKVQFTASTELRDKIERLAALMRSEIPDGDLAAVIERAVSEKLERLEARRFGRTGAPRRASTNSNRSSASRHIPAVVRRAVNQRDRGQCAFVDEHGQRCSERHRLEFHHRHPFAVGGSHDFANISLLCPAHNRHMAERDFGRSAIGRRRRVISSAAPP